MKKIINSLLKFNLRIIYAIWKKINIEFSARLWSNRILKEVAYLYKGDVLNVSASMDNDKEHGHYKDYFKNANSYFISNYTPHFNDTDSYNEIILDLESELKTELRKKFDVVFNHTVLEHIYDIKTAIYNLCELSRDTVISVVPWIQPFHHNETLYKDWWRFSPYSMSRLFKENGFETIYLNWNNDPLGNIYIFHIASTNRDKWKGKIKYKPDKYGPGYSQQLLKSNSKNLINGQINEPI